MTDFWDNLPPAWQICFDESWKAFCAGTIPIGAAVFDENDNLLMRARNRMEDTSAPPGEVCHTELAHAELNALLALGIDQGNRRGWTLYTAVEPCPLCLGAWYMSGVRGLAYACPDPWAGSVNLLGTTPYLSRKVVRVAHPVHKALEAAIVALQITYMDRLAWDGWRESAFYAAHQSKLPHLLAFADQIATSGELIGMASTNAPAQQVFDFLARAWGQFIQHPAAA